MYTNEYRFASLLPSKGGSGEETLSIIDGGRGHERPAYNVLWDIDQDSVSETDLATDRWRAKIEKGLQRLAIVGSFELAHPDLIERKHELNKLEKALSQYKQELEGQLSDLSTFGDMETSKAMLGGEEYDSIVNEPKYLNELVNEELMRLVDVNASIRPEGRAFYEGVANGIYQKFVLEDTVKYDQHELLDELNRAFERAIDKKEFLDNDGSIVHDEAGHDDKSVVHDEAGHDDKSFVHDDKSVVHDDKSVVEDNLNIDKNDLLNIIQDNVSISQDNESIIQDNESIIQDNESISQDTELANDPDLANDIDKKISKSITKKFHSIIDDFLDLATDNKTLIDDFYE